jgi:hypothetical protein
MSNHTKHNDQAMDTKRKSFKSYHNDPAIKAFHVAQAKHHLAADMLVSGTYGECNASNFRGCSIGCMAHDIDPSRDDYHKLVAEHAGWPEWLARLNDSIFEGLPKGERETFHVDLREAIPVGVDLEPVLHKLALRRIDRLIELQTSALGKSVESVDDVIQETLAALIQVRRCHEAEIGGNVCDWSAARSAAWASAEAAWASAEAAWAESAWAAAEAAWSTAESARADSAWASARSAAESARLAWASAAWSSAESARSAESAWAAAESAWESAWTSSARLARLARLAAWKNEASDLLELLKQATP